jgi:hypothetical protein
MNATKLPWEDMVPVHTAAWHGAALAVVAAIYHHIAIDVQILRDHDSADGSWDLRTEPPLEKFSPEIVAAMNAVMLYEPLLTTQDNDAAKICTEVRFRDESTIRKFARRLARTAEEELTTSQLSFFVPFPDWFDSCTTRYVHNPMRLVSDGDRRDVSSGQAPTVAEKRDNLAFLYERAVRIISENAAFFAWAKDRLFERQAVSAREIREYLGWQRQAVYVQRSLDLEES